ncbi:diguanylate cyclase [Candidatus Omnitrophota bacterium]
MNKKTSLIVVSVFVIYLVFSFFFPKSLLSLELKVFDSFSVLARNSGYFFPKLNSSQHLDEVTIVAIDDATVQKLKKKLPLPHYLFAELLQKIDAGDPRLIVFDMVLSGESEDAQGDAMLAKAIEGKSNILFPYITDDAGRTLGTDKFFVKNLPSAGYANKLIDFGSTVRRVRPMEFTYDNKIRDYATELYIFSKYHDYDLDSIVVEDKQAFLHNLKLKKEDEYGKFNFPLRRDNTIWIKYQADRADFDKMSMWGVLSDNFNPSVFKDRIVFIGTTAKIARDVYNTPIGIMSGVEIMANTALMFLDGKFFQEAPQLLKWFLILFFCVLIVFLCYHLPMIKGFLFTASVVCIMAVVTFGLFINNYYLNPSRFIFISLLAYAVINFYKYASVTLENIKLRKISTTDALTGLHSFRFFQVVMEHEFQKSLRYKTPLSLFMIDIDDFKKINDTYGHQNGNIVLSKIGQILLHNMRKADFSVRYGGEEFVIVLPHSDVVGAQKCAEILRQRIEKEVFLLPKIGPLEVTVSIGISSFPSMKITSAEEMVKLADMALYEAKHQGKNKVVVYNKGQEGPENTD